MGPRMRRRITSAKREEIEKEQKILDSTIVRPFETLEGLPISYKEPPYGHYDEVLKNPLTIKDSGVLYNSLIRSRNTYVYHAPMFKLYWVKQTAYAKKLAEMEKDKEMIKDRESRRRFAKATTNSLETKTRTSVLSADVNARDVMSKLCEASVTLGPHSMDIRIFIAKDARSEKSKAFAEISRVSDAEILKQTEQKSTPPAVNSPLPSLTQTPAQSSNQLPPQTTNLSTTQNATQQPSAQNPTQPLPLDSGPILTPGPFPSSSPGLGQISGLTSATSPVAFSSLTSLPSGQIPRQPGIPTASLIPAASSATTTSQPVAGKEIVSEQSTSAQTERVKQEPKKETESKSGTSQFVTPSEGKNGNGGVSESTQTENSTTVSTPNASKEPTSTPPTTKEPVSIPEADKATSGQPNSAQPISNPPSLTSAQDQHQVTPSQANLRAPSPADQASRLPPPPPPPQANLQSIDNLIMISNLSAIGKVDLFLNDLMKVVALGSASESQVTLFKKYIERAKQMGPQPHHAELYFSRGLPLPPNFPGAYPTRSFMDRKPPRVKVPNPMKLTAFQEKYLHSATLVFEFLENPNVRYVIPRDSISEVLEAENPPKDAEEDMEFKDILISTIWIHNIDEVEEYEKKLAEYNAEKKKKEEEEEKKRKEQEESEKKEQEGENKTDTQPEERNLRAGTKKRAPPPKKKRALELPDEPNIRFTTYSFTLHNIPARFVPIVTNSMKPLKQVQERMEHILKNGTRVPGFYLWYQVDARLDEGLAENLRNTLVQEEKKMQGLLPPGAVVETKKRKPREFKTPRPKKAKDSPGGVKQEL